MTSKSLETILQAIQKGDLTKFNTSTLKHVSTELDLKTLNILKRKFWNQLYKGSMDGKTTRYILEKFVKFKIIDVNEIIPGLNVTPLMYALLYFYQQERRFKLSEKYINYFTLLLDIGCYPNNPGSALAFAVTYCSAEICALLLKYGANPNSRFRNEDTKAISTLVKYKHAFDHDVYLHLRRIVQKISINSYETALHAAVRIKSKAKENMLLEYGANIEILWKGLSTIELQNVLVENDIDNKLSTEPIVPSVDAKLVEIINQCQSAFTLEETKDLCKAIDEAMRNLCSHISETLKRDSVTVELCGSMREGTKVFKPNEFDYVLSMDDWYMPQPDQRVIIYALVHEIIQSKRLTVSDTRLEVLNLIPEQKIGKLIAKWDGKIWKNFSVTIDIVLRLENFIQNCSRHKLLHTKKCKFDTKYRELELLEENSLVKSGYILAKAVRISSICQPENISDFDLSESVNIDDILTSHMLKQGFMDRNGVLRREFSTYTAKVQVAIGIYENILRFLNERHFSLALSRVKDWPFSCHWCAIRNITRGCCKRKRLTTAVTLQILNWLKKHENDLK